jgi:structural maintenance of chromosomes protein 5
MEDCRVRILQLQHEKDDVLLDRANAIEDHHLAVEEIELDTELVDEAEIKLIAADVDLRALKARDIEIINQSKEKEEEIKQFAREAEEAKKEARESLEKVQQIVAEYEDVGLFNTMAEDKTVEDIEHEIGAEEAKLELIHGVDPSIVRQFESRGQEIEKLSRHKDELTSKLEGIAHAMDDVRSRWEPRLDTLINQINEAFAYNFEQISCAGEVGVHKHEDFDQWSIEIKVKFRYVSHDALLYSSMGFF